jgi:hypothetical protein
MPKWTLDESIAYARSQIGETDGRKYAKIAVGWASPYDWCAYFDSAIKVLGELDCPYFPNGFAFDKRDLGVIGDRWVEPLNIQAGDFIGFDWDGGGQWGGDHVGYVVQRVAAGDYWTVEGNCGGEVRLKHRTIENTRSYYSDGSIKGIGIIGGIRPKYAPEKKELKALPLLKKGDKGGAVVALQHLLMLRGVVTFYNIDGVFGDKTEAAVKEFQQARGIYPDGKVGAKTWPALTAK